MADRQFNHRTISRQLLLMGHRNRPRLRPWSWIVGGFAGGGLLLLLAWNGLRGECRIYQSGPLSTAHKMFENDCARCHEHWGVLTSLWSETYRSVPNQKCETCHAGLAHFAPVDVALAESLPQKENKACVSCHSEHNGGHRMTAVADMTCTNCHANLVSIAGHSESFAPKITDLSSHPEFAIHRLTAASSEDDIPPPGPGHLAHTVVAPKQRVTDQSEKWQDGSAIQFSHAKHLSAELAGTNGQALQCDDCHAPDPQREYFKPIVFEQHCKRCHLLIFDTEHLRETETQKIVAITDFNPARSYEPLTVPHESPAAVRGYLTDVYAIQSALQNATHADGSANDFARVKPSQPLTAQELTNDASDEIRRKVAAAESTTLNFTKSHHGVLLSNIPEKTPLGQQLRALPKSGGCGFCHEISPTEARRGTSDLAGPMWQIQPTRIPSPILEDSTQSPRIPGKWLPHARFDHDTHRMVTCATCHHKTDVPEAGVIASTNAGDVLMPRIEICRKCHTENLKGSDWTHVGVTGAKTSCVECHRYHHRAGEGAVENQTRSLEAIRK